MSDRQSWRGAAACAGLGFEFKSAKDDFFFILPGQKSKRAKLFCAECPVKRACLEFALIYDEQGIWGGTTDEERKDFPSYIVEELRRRERETVGMESRNYEDFIPRSETYSQEVRQLTVTTVTTVQYHAVSYQQLPAESAEEPLEVRLAVLDHLFEQTNVLLASLH